MTEPAESTPLPSSHGDYVPGSEEFVATRQGWRESLAADSDLRARAVSVQVEAEKHNYTYTWEWAGVPIIRLPDDVMVMQEIFWSYRPECVVETGVARGGSLLLNASLMTMCGQTPRVLGIDHKIFSHTTNVLREHPLSHGVTLLEEDSTSTATRETTRDLLGDAQRAVLVLDSNHTHDHVLAELRSLAPLLPNGGLVLVADTLIEEFPAGHFEGRPWDIGNNPKTAVDAFLAESPEFARAEEWGRRALSSEFRDGILRRIAGSA